MYFESIQQKSERKETSEAQRGNEKLLTASFWVAQGVMRLERKIIGQKEKKNKIKIRHNNFVQHLAVAGHLQLKYTVRTAQ